MPHGTCLRALRVHVPGRALQSLKVAHGPKSPERHLVAGGEGTRLSPRQARVDVTQRSHACAPPTKMVTTGPLVIESSPGHALGTPLRDDTHSPQAQSSWCLESGYQFFLQRLIEFAAEPVLSLGEDYSLLIQFLSWM